MKTLPYKKRTGVFPRCVLLTEGTPTVVAERLNRIIGVPEVRVSEHDRWKPYGRNHVFNITTDNGPLWETKLTREPGFLAKEDVARLRKWWGTAPAGAGEPKWDIVSTCSIEGKQGLVLMETKTNVNVWDKAGKRVNVDPTEDILINSERIDACLKECCDSFSETTSESWGISASRCYQISLRFAWAWKIASLGYPIVLLHLGFGNSMGMELLEKPTFKNGLDFINAMLSVTKHVIPRKTWGIRTTICGTPFYPLLRFI